ncbi:MAG: MMPL family transporter [Clostridiales bacterium]|nr:MMPL family transporter [Clostridiales bacterium]
MKLHIKPNKHSHSVVDFIVNKQRRIQVFFGIVFLLSLFCNHFVKINYDLTKYLPNTVLSKQGIDIMKKEFGYPGTARVMLDNVSLYEAKAYKDKLAAVDGVDLVLWADTKTEIYQSNEFIKAKDIEDYFKNGHAVMDIVFKEEDSSPITSKAISEMKTITGNKGHFIGSAVQNKSLNESLNKEITNATIIGVVMIIIILCHTTTSWFEPVLFLLVMGIAIMINNGTNIFLGEISFLTSSVSAILQLAVAMDYSIFLIHSFTSEKEAGVEPKKAIANAIRHSADSILACGVATIIGFVALTLMKFSIGFDMGIVLAKGIFVSLITVLFLMPSLIMKWSGLIEKTAHRSFVPSFQKFGEMVYKSRFVVIILVLILTIPSYVGKGLNDFLYGNDSVGASEGTKVYEDEQAINAQFGRSNLLLLLVPNTSMVKEKQLSDTISDLSFVKSVTSLANTLPQGIPESILPDSILSRLHTKDYSRILVYIKTKSESSLAFECSDQIQSIVKQYYPNHSYVVGVTPCTQDIKTTITKDYDFVDLLSLLGVAFVVMIVFKSIFIPVLVIIPIEVAIFINMAFPYLVGEKMVFMGYIIVSCIQLGATVDYSILMTNNYLNCRKGGTDRTGALIDAVKTTAPPVLTSGMILASVGYILHFTSSITAIGDIGHLIGRGALFSMALVIILLPALLHLFDNQITKSRLRQKRIIKQLHSFRETALKNG